MASLRAIAKDHKIRITLTAGLDSRVVVAAAVSAGIEFETFTYVGAESHSVDEAVANEIAKYLGIKQQVLRSPTVDKDFIRHLERTNFPLHHGSWVGEFIDYFSEPNMAVILGNALEIGRSNTMGIRRKFAKIPLLNGRNMALIHRRRFTGKSIVQAVKDYGLNNYIDFSTERFNAFIEETEYLTALQWLDPYDLFYWEQRMSTWQGPAMNERDFYALPLIPYNSRDTYVKLLGVKKEERYADEHVYRMIEMVDPKLLDWPVNPLKWPENSYNEPRPGNPEKQ